LLPRYLTSPASSDLLRQTEERYPPLESAGRSTRAIRYLASRINVYFLMKLLLLISATGLWYHRGLAGVGTSQFHGFVACVYSDIFKKERKAGNTRGHVRKWEIVSLTCTFVHRKQQF
jgi:hypothetical protein